MVQTFYLKGHLVLTPYLELKMEKKILKRWIIIPNNYDESNHNLKESYNVSDTH